MVDYVDYINKTLKSDKFIKSPEFDIFMNNVKDLNNDDRLKYFADVLNKNEYSDDIKNNCKYILKGFAYSGIKGSTTERNINLVYNLIKKD